MSETEVKKEAEAVEEQKSVVNKDAVPAEKSPLKNDAEDLGSAVVKPTDSNPDATKKAKKVSDQVNKDAKDGSLPKDQKPSDMKEEEAEVQGEEEIAETKEESTEMNIDLSDDVKALVSTDADLSEEFKEKAATIFETAVKTRIQEQVKVLEAQYEDKLSKESETIKEAMTEKVDSYLNYVVEEWMKENELAVEKGIRSELVEDFMTGLKNLFTEHYIDIPEEKVDLVDDLFEKVEELEQKLDESINDNVEVKKQLAEYKKEETLREVSEGLADTEKEKLKTLSDGVDFEDDEQYKEKIEVIKENYFPPATESQPQTITEEVVNSPSDEEVEKVDPAMDLYVKAMKRQNN